jgi:UDP-3-O-[3-hydroxymyristoyl] N-acetylglucosamine deacetylase
MTDIFSCIGSRKAQTIKEAFSFKSLGIHSGKEVALTCLPQQSGGIVFKRKDLEFEPTVVADVKNVINTTRCTVIGQGSVTVSTVEHLMSALKVAKVDHLLIELDGPEVPILDGSSLAWSQKIEGNILELESEIPQYALNQPLYYTKGAASLVALPFDGFKISYTLHYPNHPILENQFFCFTVSWQDYIKQVAPSRTFALYEEVKPLLDAGHIQGGSLKNAIVIKGDEVLCDNGLRFNNEMCRHKVLDLIGDFSLASIDLNAHFISIGSGHGSNVGLAQKISNSFSLEKIHV